MKKGTILAAIIAFLVGLFGLIAIDDLFIKEPKLKDAAVKTVTITAINEGTTNDIVFTDSQGETYYINRGLEQNLILDSLNAKVLNKTVTLHLPKNWLGTSEHIAQLTVNDVIIFTEFSPESENSED
ncbi:hypothetical protein SAMN04487989_101339 [Bizionia echini]|uniref:Uncharacterized protein n=1 Tax=Bizionia echini TaxID=649333 RepID=A0A1I4YX69_9FLAO|nr:hypothetical protein [Bizionia echini]MBP93977.1 hypothetical protein [Flavobacteriaceae bacterium]SFN42363.1 hypothetical protein SAMN04487989_101339 [Bizionia echini]|tara:strand:- start:181 stop:561 length:381 start_codon:yes stop_codon:yes gene_type:complete